MTYEKRQELNGLSLEAFGVRSRWQTMLRKPRIVAGVSVWLTLPGIEEAMKEIIIQRGEINERLRQKNRKEEDHASPGQGDPGESGSSNEA